MTFGLKNRKCLRFFPYLVTISGAQKKRKIGGGLTIVNKGSCSSNLR